MSMEIPPIKKAGLLPTANHIKNFSTALEKFNASEDQNDLLADNNEQELHNILSKFNEMATLQGDFFFCRQTQMQTIAKHLNDVPLSFDEKYSLCMAPVNENCQRSMNALKIFAQEYLDGNFSGLNRATSPEKSVSFQDLSTLCNFHAELDLFLWLWHRFYDGKEEVNNLDLDAAKRLKEETITLINYGLADADKLTLDHCYMEKDRRNRKSWENQNNRKSWESQNS